MKRIFVLAAVAAFLCLGQLSQAQTIDGTISGRVTDSTGAVIPGAKVNIVNVATGINYPLTTNGAGLYNAASVAPGTYNITISAAGFKDTVIRGIILNAQGHVNRETALAPGAAASTVTVNAGTNTINTTTATVGTTINRQFIENIPLNGQSFQSLIELTPGVVPGVASFGNQGQFTVNGQRANSNYYTVDGVSANFGGVSGGTFVSAGGALPALSAQGGTNSLISIDATQEFSIQTSTYAPEYGRTPGAQIAIESRSGTNQFHGNVYEYFRNTALDANGWFNDNLNIPKPGEHTNDFGGVLGGPIDRNKAFFFFSYEGQRLILPQTQLTQVPSLAARAAAPPALAVLLNAFPKPNGPDLTDGSMVAPFNTSYSDPSSLNTYAVRIDDNIGKKWRIFGRFSDAPSKAVSRGPETTATSANNIFPGNFITRSLTAGVTTLINDRLTNDFRFNYGFSGDANYLYLTTFGGATVPPDSALFPSTQPFNHTNAEFQFVASLINTDTSIAVGDNTASTQTQYNYVDNFSVEAGKHELKFGVDYRKFMPHYAPAHYVVAPIYLTVPTVVANLLAEGFVGYQVHADVFEHNVGFYAQDTWRATPRLTLTYGLRWDLDSTPTLGNGLKFVSVTGFGGNGSNLNIAPLGTPIYKKTYGNVAPRFGFNYQLHQTPGHETVLRGGWGIFYDLVSQSIADAISNQRYPFGAQRILVGPILGGTSSFPFSPAEVTPPPINLVRPVVQAVIFNPNLKLPYTYEYNAAIEQALGSAQSVSVSYVGATGRRLLQSSEGAPPNPNFARLVAIDNTSTSDYNALQIQFKRQVTQGLQALASYTWSHSIDTASTDSGSGNDDTIVLGENPNVNRGDSDFDIRNSGSVGLTYTMPKLQGSLARRELLGGWSVDTLFLAYSAAPLTVLDNNLKFPGLNIVVRPDVVPGQPFYQYGNVCPNAATGKLQPCPGGRRINPLAFKDPPSTNTPNGPVPVRQGTLRRNSLRALPITQWNFSFHRDFALPKTLDLQFKADFFNIINHPNFGGFVTGFGTPVNPLFGQATETYAQSLGTGGVSGGFNPLFNIGGPRSLQLALKLMF